MAGTDSEDAGLSILSIGSESLLKIFNLSQDRLGVSKEQLAVVRQFNGSTFLLIKLQIVFFLQVLEKVG
jgi:hypothetical protein